MLDCMEEASKQTQGLSLSPESEGLTLPNDLELLEVIGTGKLCRVYKAMYQGEMVALKSYSQQAVTLYRKKLNKNIAVFEMLQNRAFRKVPELLPYTAKPVRVIGQDGKLSLCYLQEFVDGPTLEELVSQTGHFPGSLITTGEAIDRICEEQGVEGVDQFMEGVRVREHAGVWTPIMFDFKHFPLPRTSSGNGGFFFRSLSLGKKGPPRKGFLKNWDELRNKAEKARS
jgi:hypothetical protein